MVIDVGLFTLYSLLFTLYSLLLTLYWCLLTLYFSLLFQYFFNTLFPLSSFHFPLTFLIQSTLSIWLLTHYSLLFTLSFVALLSLLSFVSFVALLSSYSNFSFCLLPIAYCLLPLQHLFPIDSSIPLHLLFIYFSC